MQSAAEAAELHHRRCARVARWECYVVDVDDVLGIEGFRVRRPAFEDLLEIQNSLLCSGGVLADEPGAFLAAVRVSPSAKATASSSEILPLFCMR